MSRLWAAVAIGGTKSSVALARDAGDDAFDWIGTSYIPTCADAAHTLMQLTDALASQLAAVGAGHDGAGTDGSGPGGTAPRLAGIGIVICVLSRGTMGLIALWLRRLAREREEAGALLSSVGEGVATLAPSGEIRRVNPALEALTGRSSAELVGREQKGFGAVGVQYLQQ